MTERTIHNKESYVRLLDSGGTDLTSTVPGSLDVGSSLHDNFNTNANLQISDVDLAFGQVTMSSSLPVTIASDQSAVEVAPPVVGSQANASNAQVTAGPDEASTNSIDVQYNKVVSAFGNVSQACTITLQQSQDDVTFYNTGYSYTALASGDFFISATDFGARYAQLVYSDSGTTVTATIVGK